jgi:transposase
MAFLVEQNVKGVTYVYRTEGYWDKGKQQARHHRVFIGKKDPKTGKIIPAKAQLPARECRDFGNYYFLKTIAHQTGLLSVLEDVFPDIWREILTCAFYEISERKPLYLCAPWSLSTATIDNITLSSQNISELLKSLGNRDRDRMIFFRTWAKKRLEQECIAYDITSISSYSKLNEFLEFGHNRDDENLPQINMAMLFGETSLLPIFYSVIQGSIRDMTTISNMLQYAKELEISMVRFIMDKGFYSDANVKEMTQNGLKYAIAVPFTTQFAKTQVDKMREKLKSPIKSFNINGDIIHGEVQLKKIHGHRGYLFVYYNERYFLDAKENLLKRIMHLEQKIEGKSKLPSGLSDPSLKYLNIRRSKSGLRIQRDEDAINKFLRYKGFMVMLSNTVRDEKECLHLYRSKDTVERAFDNMKNELDMKRLRIHSEVSMNGRTFMAFIALIIHSWIDKKMKEKNLYKSYTQEEVMCVLKRLKIIELSDKRTIFTELSKKQKYLYKVFGIPEPSKSLL